MPSSGADGRALTLLDDVRWHGTSVPGERTRALLAALAAAPEGAGEGRLIEEIWGDDVPANPTKALQVVVSRARAATSPDAVVRTPRGYRLGTPDTDLAALRRGHADALRAEASGEHAVAVAAARPVTSLAVAAGDDGELGRVRAAARTTQRSARAILGRSLSALGRHAEALSLLEDAADDEPTLVALLRSEAAVRGAAVALERYGAVREGLADRLGVDPGPALQEVHAELLARDRPVRQGLVFESSPLIGRDHDVVAVAATLHAARVTSIVGAGGLGKTRLAHLMGRLAEQPVVHFVELAGVTAPEGVAAAVGDALGVREASVSTIGVAARRADLVTRIVEQVGTAPALLILDNCEHLVGAVADLVALLVARTPALRVLTTTRAPLGIAAERVYLLPQLGTDDAVQLFCERASAARPGARLDVAVVRPLVDRLDGLPLAIELAAAKVRAMSVPEVHRRLEDRFALLRGGARDAPERHQTLLAVIDWSWNLLEEAERRALRRLAVFRDGFSLGAAQAVVGEDPVGAVSHLVDQSLLGVHEGTDGLRYRMLETVREFGMVQLAEVGDDADTRARLRDWAVGFARAASARVFGPEQVDAVAAVRAEEGNLVDVLHRGLADDDVGAVLPVMAALSDLWTIEGSHLKVVNHAGAVVGLATGAEVPADLADELRVVLAATGLNTLIFSARPAVAAFARLRELGPGERPHTAALVRVLSALAEAGVGGFGDPDLLLPFIGTADRDTARLALQWRTQALENAGRLDEALETGRRCVELSDVADGPWAGALALSQLAGLAMQVGDLAAARLHAEQALPTMEALDATEDLAQLRALLVAVALDEGSVDEAERLMGLIEADDRHRSVFGGRVTVRCGYAEVALARGDVDAGLAGYRAALEAVRGPDTSRGVEMPVELAPWVLYPEAAALAAHLRHGRGAEVPGLRESLRDRVESLLGGGGYLDVPVAGTVLYVLALAELVRPGGPPEDLDLAARLLVLADVFSYNRSLPSLGWAFAADLAERVRPGSLARARSSYAGRAALELRDEARRLVTELH